MEHRPGRISTTAASMSMTTSCIALKLSLGIFWELALKTVPICVMLRTRPILVYQIKFYHFQYRCIIKLVLANPMFPPRRFKLFNTFVFHYTIRNIIFHNNLRFFACVKCISIINLQLHFWERSKTLKLKIF